MIKSLLSRQVVKRPDRLRIKGRVLLLADDAGLIRRQLEGEEIPYGGDLKLRDDISTDEITPAYICFHFDQRLGDFPYLGLRAGGEFPIKAGDVRKGGFVASAAGSRRGKGSSREQSPYAEMCAGIQVAIAESIERIYKQNCQNLGLLTSTDFGLIERIRRGEDIPLVEFTRGEDDITRQIIEYGGLFPFNVARLQGKVTLPRVETAPRPMTLGEKILARHLVGDLARDETGVPAVKPGDTGFVRCDIRFSHEYVTPMAAIFFESLVGEQEKVNDPSSIYFFRDHLTFLDEVMPPERVKMGLLDLAHQLEAKQKAFAAKQGIRLHGEIDGPVKGSEGICHSIVYQDYALPGQVVVGSDSHTPHSGALGCVAFGIGTTDVFNSWITKDVRVRIPETVRIVVKGRKPANVTAKDFMLYILAHPYVKSGKALAKIIEYCGPAVEALEIDERATMTNMAAEVGGFTGIVAPDAKTADFLVRHRGMTRAEAERHCEGWFSDPDAAFAETLEFDASTMQPIVASPGDPGNGIPIEKLGARVKVDIAYGGSCTAGKREDMDMYAKVLADALAAGRRVHPDVRFYIQYGAQEVKQYCVEKGYAGIFERAGVHIVEPSCGACINAGPGASSSKDQVVISAQNRNFPGRSGPGQMYLASPLTVAASAVEGFIAPYEPAAVTA
ncbi:MAG TPA: aconitase family protein [Patescibacteria group bacterium]|jgi:3-isopropylmalate/(R)-2-methylmalate dehydratase large subunit|nr:aconitase family protein [Patescibacteria group bacterium]